MPIKIEFMKIVFLWWQLKKLFSYYNSFKLN